MQLCSSALVRNPGVVNVCESVNILSSYPRNTKSQAVSLFSPAHHFTTTVSGVEPLVFCRATVQRHYLCYFRSSANLVRNAATGSINIIEQSDTKPKKIENKDRINMRAAVALFGAGSHPVLCSLRTVIVSTFVAQVQLHNIITIY